MCQGGGITVEVIVGWIASAGIIMAALAALAVRVLMNVHDIQAAFEQLRRHEDVLNGSLKKPQEGRKA